FRRVLFRSRQVSTCDGSGWSGNSRTAGFFLLPFLLGVTTGSSGCLRGRPGLRRAGPPFSLLLIFEVSVMAVTCCMARLRVGNDGRPSCIGVPRTAHAGWFLMHASGLRHSL